MGAGQSKEELLYQEVQNGNHDAVKALRRNGASLEWVDKEGRTPLILACTRGELLDMAITLLNLGANIDAYRPGAHRGTPLHHAAKRGLEKTVTLLLSRGANPLTINDEGLTPLQMARNRGHVSVVRILEEQLCLFSGMLREISGFSFFETIARTLVTKRIWAVVLPTETHSRRPPKYELAVYPSIKVPQPKTLISLAEAEIEEPKFNTSDPVLYITDKTSKTKYRFLSDHEGDKAQLERLYKACRGVPQISLAAASGQLGNNASQNLPVGLQGSGTATPVLQSSSSDASRPANQTGTEPSEPDDYNGWDTQAGSHNGWGPPDGGGKSEKQPKKTNYGGWEGDQSTYNGWGPSEAGPSRRQSSPSNQQTTTASLVQPSAPPIPEGPIYYPSVDVMQTGPDPLLGSQNPDANIMTDDKAGGMCVICWDAPAEGACVPCGHLAGCMDCLAEVKAKNWGCPVCREQIQQVVKVFAV